MCRLTVGLVLTAPEPVLAGPLAALCDLYTLSMDVVDQLNKSKQCQIDSR